MDPQREPTGEEGSNWHHRRKRIVAREVSSQSEPSSAPTVEAGDVVNLDPMARHTTRESLIVDPTQVVGQRQRRHGENLRYRVTQASIGLAFLLAAVAIACVLTDESLMAQILAGSAFSLAVLGVYLVRQSRLAYRLRGYAAAAGILAALSLIGSFLPSPFHQ